MNENTDGLLSLRYGPPMLSLSIILLGRNLSIDV